jgi:hypothetical protein
LQLDDAEEAEYIIAKAIRDGVIDATISHDGGFVQSKVGSYPRAHDIRSYWMYTPPTSLRRRFTSARRSA